MIYLLITIFVIYSISLFWLGFECGYYKEFDEWLKKMRTKE